MFHLKRRLRLTQPEQDNDEAPLPMHMTDRGDVALEMTTNRTDFWKTWLESYDCFEHAYSSKLFVPKTRTLSEDVTHLLASLSADTAPTTPVAHNDITVTCAPDIEAPLSVETTPPPPPQSSSLEFSEQSTTDNADDNKLSATTRPLTPPPPAGYRPVPLDSDYEDDGLTCAICLLLLEETPAAEMTESGVAVTAALTEPQLVDSAVDDIEACQLSSAAATVGSAVVRYPCHGSHYFHSPCLHHWLQSVSSRSTYARAATNNVPNYSKITCPICREAPFRENVHPAPTHTAPWPITTPSAVPAISAPQRELTPLEMIVSLR
eukprot:gene27078-33748_t